MLYKSNKIKKFLFALVIPMFLVTLPVVAQSVNNASQYTLVQQSQSESRQSQQFQDKELKKFADIMKSIQQVQVESNQKMKEAFSDSSLTQKRFNTLYTARKNSDAKKAPDETETETKAFNKLADQIRTIQMDSQKKMVKIVRDKGMTVDKFNSIAKALRSNPELGNRVKQFM